MIAKLKPNGLTLLEVIVAVGLFAVMALIITRVFIRVMDVQQKIQEQQSLEGDFRYAVNIFADEIQKALPFGAVNNCSAACAACPQGTYFCTGVVSGVTHLCMNDQNGVCVEYFSDATSGVGQLYVKRAASTYTLTSREIYIDSLTYGFTNPGAADPSNVVTLRVAMHANKTTGEKLYFQTALTKLTLQ